MKSLRMPVKETERFTGTEIRLVVTKVTGVGKGIHWEFGIGKCKLLYLESINNKVLL